MLLFGDEEVALVHDQCRIREQEPECTSPEALMRVILNAILGADFPAVSLTGAARGTREMVGPETRL